MSSSVTGSVYLADNQRGSVRLYAEQCIFTLDFVEVGL